MVLHSIVVLLQNALVSKEEPEESNIEYKKEVKGRMEAEEKGKRTAERWECAAHKVIEWWRRNDKERLEEERARQREEEERRRIQEIFQEIREIAERWEREKENRAPRRV